MFELGQEATDIIYEIVKAHNGKIDCQALYGDDANPDWIYLDNDIRVTDLFLDSHVQGDTVLTVEDEYGEVFHRNLSNLNPDERMNIAATLIEKEL